MNATQQNATDAVNDRITSLPLLHSWRSVYLFVTGAFVVWVVLLTALQRMFQ